MASITWDAQAKQPKVEFMPADEYTGQDLYEVFPKLYERFGKGVSIAGCGVAGEYRLWQLGHRVQRHEQEPHPLRRARRPGRGDGQQGPQVHHQRWPGRARRQARGRGGL